MASLLQKIYWRAPYFMKGWMASLNARKLDRWRHGPEYTEIMASIAERDKWSLEQFQAYQREKLCKLIRHAAKNIPYYRKVFAEAGIDAEKFRGPEDLTRLPILEKQTVRSNPLQFVDDRLDPSKLTIGHTSGTTGTPLDLYRDVTQESTAFAYMGARYHKVAGMLRRRNRSVSVGGHLITAPGRKKPPFWVVNKQWQQLYMSSYHLSPDNLKYYVEKIREFKPDYIENIPSSIYTIAHYIVENKLEPIQCKACFTMAETLFDYHREAIRAAFGCRTYNQYGCGEMCVFAAECEEGSLHLSPEVGIVEVVDENDQPVPAGQTGQLICTSLVAWVQPFIRYRLGDMGALSDEPCSCGRSLPVLAKIEGRTDDVLIARDGRRIGRLTPIFKGMKGIVEAQIIQKDFDEFIIRVVPGEAYREQDGLDLRKNLIMRIGEAKVDVVLVKEIARSAGGKFRTVSCEIPKEKLEMLNKGHRS